jgi:hypothetical protein
LVVIQLSDATRSVFVTASCVRADALLLAGVFRLLSTLLTPSTDFVAASATVFAFELLAEPSSVTTPLVVVTLISDFLRLSLPISLAFTLVVMTVSVSVALTLSLWGCGTVSSPEAAPAVPMLTPVTRPTAINMLRTAALQK